MTKTLALAIYAAILFPMTAVAQMGGTLKTPVPTGTYKIDSKHTLAMFSINHMGFNNFYGIIPDATGTLIVDSTNPSADTLDVTLPASEISTTNNVLDGELKDPTWLDTAKHPNMHFTSTRVTQTGPHTARIEGNFWMHGVMKPVVLEATFGGAGVNPLSKAFTVGFSATGNIKRSDFGVTKYIPLIGDDVKLVITAAFEKQG